MNEPKPWTGAVAIATEEQRQKFDSMRPDLNFWKLDYKSTYKRR
jgi:hypothetical protein